ncbi:MAG: hypothetical protein RI894_315 [Bacteroidota bacterium]|jgi:hypothetical protein
MLGTCSVPYLAGFTAVTRFFYANTIHLLKMHDTCYFMPFTENCFFILANRRTFALLLFKVNLLKSSF